MNELVKFCNTTCPHFFRSLSTFWQIRCCVYRTWRSCQKYNKDFFKFLWPSQKNPNLLMERQIPRILYNCTVCMAPIAYSIFHLFWRMTQTWKSSHTKNPPSSLDPFIYSTSHLFWRMTQSHNSNVWHINFTQSHVIWRSPHKTKTFGPNYKINVADVIT